MSRFVLCSLVLAPFAFADEAKGPPKADVRGKVESVFGIKARGFVGSMLVKGTKEKDTAYDQASVRIPTTAKVYRWDGGKKTAAAFGDIKKGDKVQAVFSGPVAESFPVQATASEVIILDPEKKKDE